MYNSIVEAFTPTKGSSLSAASTSSSAFAPTKGSSLSAASKIDLTIFCSSAAFSYHDYYTFSVDDYSLIEEPILSCKLFDDNF